MTPQGEGLIVPDDVCVEDVCYQGDVDILHCSVDTMQGDVMTTCPPPVFNQVADVIARTTPSDITHQMEDDNRLTLYEEGEVTTDGVSVVVDVCNDDDDRGDKEDSKSDHDVATSLRNDDVNTEAGDIMSVEHSCEFRRGICTLHKIKGEKTQRKVKKWAKKRYGYGWVTNTIVEYTCHLGYSGYTASRDIQNRVQISHTALNNSKGQNVNKEFPGLPIGEMNG